jgi:hypothetical protein
MLKRSLVAGLMTISGALPAPAQHGSAQQDLRTVPAEARQYAFLVGQFELTVKPQVAGLAARLHGVPKMLGTWKGWRALDGFGIEDELRITDESGNPRLLSHATRYFDAVQRKWIASTLDVYRGVFTMSTAEWRDNVMTASSRGTDAEGKPYVSRSTYSDITPTSFRFKQERSVDDGKTWKENLIIDAKRVAATAAR